MSQFRSVSTILNTTYTVGDIIGKGVISDITLGDVLGGTTVVTVWARPKPSEDETTAIVIPYHSVELLVK